MERKNEIIVNKICKVNGITTRIAKSKFVQDFTINKLSVAIFESGTTIIELKGKAIAVSETETKFIKLGNSGRYKQ
jgi:hypothetical protein